MSKGTYRRKKIAPIFNLHSGLTCYISVYTQLPWIEDPARKKILVWIHLTLPLIPQNMRTRSNHFPPIHKSYISTNGIYLHTLAANLVHHRMHWNTWVMNAQHLSRIKEKNHGWNDVAFELQNIKNLSFSVKIYKDH